MIIVCKEIYNENTKEYSSFHRNNSFIKGNHYNVLEVMFTSRGMYYRIITDDSGMYSFSIIVRAKEFEIVTNTIPDNWTLDKQHSSLLPEKWSNMSLWQESFWQDYDASIPKAIECYREEIKEILATDKEYIKKMIEERSNIDSLQMWRETMIPLFSEIISS